MIAIGGFEPLVRLSQSQVLPVRRAALDSLSKLARIGAFSLPLANALLM